jgi:hypothetical protein
MLVSEFGIPIRTLKAHIFSAWGRL